MEMTIQLPETVARRVRELPDPEAFVAEVVTKALELTVTVPKDPVAGPSKWARLVEQIEADPVHLDGYSKQLKRDMREFRENFEFKHDRG